MKRYAILMIVLALALMVGMTVTTFTLNKNVCEAHWKQSGLESRYSLMGGCQVFWLGHWIPDHSVVVPDDQDGDMK